MTAPGVSSSRKPVNTALHTSSSALSNPGEKAAAPYFKPYLADRLQFDWKTGSLLLGIFTVVRFVLVLHANVTRSYQIVALIFGVMLLVPFLVLTRAGRQAIGLNRPRRWWGLVLGGVLGALSCTVLFYLAKLFFGLGEGNSLRYIASTYANLPTVLDEQNRFVYFLIYAGPSMLFSPVGEEVFYRGLIHECFAGSVGTKRASWVDSAAFALVHLAHFGLLYVGGTWHFLPAPALLWVVSLFFTCLLFSVARARSGSVLGAIVAHAVFNLTMNYFIFYHILG